MEKQSLKMVAGHLAFLAGTATGLIAVYLLLRYGKFKLSENLGVLLFVLLVAFIMRGSNIWGRHAKMRFHPTKQQVDWSWIASFGCGFLSIAIDAFGEATRLKTHLVTNAFILLAFVGLLFTEFLAGLASRPEPKDAK